MGDIATRISAELRNEYVLGYKTDNTRMDGKWRKVKVKLQPPPGLPQLTVHARTGYYAPLQKISGSTNPPTRFRPSHSRHFSPSPRLLTCDPQPLGLR